MSQNESEDVGSPEVLRWPEVEQRTGLERRTAYRLIALREFPRQIRIGRRIVGWLAVEIDAWISDRMAEREAGNEE